MNNHQWMAVLRSVAAYEIYRREYHGRIEPEKVAELLLLHPRHPRSVRFNISTLHTALQAISGSGPDSYANGSRAAGREDAGAVCSTTASRTCSTRGLHSFLTDLEKTCRSDRRAVARSYFYYAVVA